MDITRLLSMVLLCLGALTTTDEFQVNLRTAGNQCNVAVAAEADGRFVLVWSSYYSSSGRSNDIVARRFDSDGNPAGDEFQVNATSAGNQTEPAAAADENGLLFVAWQGPGIDGDEDVYARVLDANGVFLTEELPVNTEKAGRQVCPSVAAGRDGAFIVVWESQAADGTEDNTTIRGQRFDPNGIAVGPELWIDEDSYDCRYPDIASDGAGNFVVTWIQDRTNKTVRIRLFDPNGLALTDPLDVSTADIASMTSPSIAIQEGGDFVVVWDGDPERASQDDVHARCFDPNGLPRSEPFVVNTLSEGPQQWPQVALNDANEFVVAWQHDHDDPDLATDVFARQFDMAGQPLGAEAKLNGYVAGKQRYPAVAMNETGAFLTAWESDDQDGSGYGIFAYFTACTSVADLNTDGAR